MALANNEFGFRALLNESDEFNKLGGTRVEGKGGA
jgi:hypothetical protein